MILIPRGFSPGWANLDRLTGPAAELIAQSGGMLVDYTKRAPKSSTRSSAACFRRISPDTASGSPAAMRLFAKVLRRMPEDQAARWYLFRCDALRGGGVQAADTELLFDWGDPGHA